MPTAQFNPALLIQIICQFKYLMHKESQKIQQKEVHGKVMFTMSIIVLYMIPLILQGIECLVLDLPPASATFYKRCPILLHNRDVSFPTVMVCCFSLINYPVFKIVDPERIGVPIQRNFIYPFIYIQAPLSIF